MPPKKDAKKAGGEDEGPQEEEKDLIEKELTISYLKMKLAACATYPSVLRSAHSSCFARQLVCCCLPVWLGKNGRRTLWLHFSASLNRSWVAALMPACSCKRARRLVRSTLVPKEVQASASATQLPQAAGTVMRTAACSVHRSCYQDRSAFACHQTHNIPPYAGIRSRQASCKWPTSSWPRSSTTRRAS